MRIYSYFGFNDVVDMKLLFSRRTGNALTRIFRVAEFILVRLRSSFTEYSERLDKKELDLSEGNRTTFTFDSLGCLQPYVQFGSFMIIYFLT